MALGEFAASLPLGSCCHRRVGVVFNSHLDDFRGVIFVNASSSRSAEFGLQIAIDSRERHAEKTHFISAGSGRR
jgi:hypothetical protein